MLIIFKFSFIFEFGCTFSDVEGQLGHMILMSAFSRQHRMTEIMLKIIRQNTFVVYHRNNLSDQK